jgi:hypothetical protein
MGPWTFGTCGGSKWSPEASVDQWSPIPITLMMSRIWIRIKLKMDPDPGTHRIKVMRIRNPGTFCNGLLIEKLFIPQISFRS